MANRLIETLSSTPQPWLQPRYDKITEVYHEETVTQIFFTLQSNIELTKYDFIAYPN